MTLQSIPVSTQRQPFQFRPLREDAHNALLDSLANQVAIVEKRKRNPEWSPKEDEFIKTHLGWLTDDEMADAMPGRTAIAVHLRWDRDLALPGPSKAQDVITANSASDLLGIDGHKVAGWVDMGLIPGRIMAGRRNIRLIHRETFRRWALNPMNWMYFDIRRVRDPELKRMMGKRAKRWGDEWWPLRRVADYHGVDTKDVLRYIKLGRVSFYRLPISLGGRHHDRKWSNHFILKSDAIKLKFVHRGDDRSTLTPRGKVWIGKALKMEMTATDIGRTMKVDSQTALNWIHKYYPKAKLPKGRSAWSKRRKSKDKR